MSSEKSDENSQMNQENSKKIPMETTEKVNGNSKDDEANPEQDQPMSNPLVDWTERTKVFEVGQWHSCNLEHYTRGCLFSPDGTCVLTNVNQDGVLVFELPTDLYDKQNVKANREISCLKPVFHIKEGRESTVYDMAWNPQLNSQIPDTCSFLVSRQQEPIKCYDAFDGHLICSYRGYDAVDEVEAAYSVCYAPASDKIYGGYRKSVKIFDPNRPGRDYQTIDTKFTTSAMAAAENLLACGSWNTTISVYDPREAVVPVSSMRGHKGGVTHLKLLGDTYLVSGGRKDPKIILWDLRNTAEPFFVYERVVETNQRIYFDVSWEGKWLATGGTDGRIRVWNMFEAFADQTQPTTEFSFDMYENCCNGFSFHPFLPVFATSSGQVKLAEDEAETCSTQNFLTMWWIEG